MTNIDTRILENTQKSERNQYQLFTNNGTESGLL